MRFIPGRGNAERWMWMRKIDRVFDIVVQVFMIFAIAFAMVACVMAFRVFHLQHKEPVHEQYARSAVVYYIDEAEDTVTFIDGCGFIWAIKGVFDWETGDLAALLMDNNGTSGTIGDDIVVDAWYSSLGWQIREGIA